MSIALTVNTLAATSPPAAEPPAAAAIRARRAESNAAVAAHDFAAMKRHYLPDFTILPGSRGTPSNVAAFEARLAETFAEPSFVSYVRTPVTITIGASGKRAAEVGTWVGTWHFPDGERRLTGVYQAMWLPTPDGWRLQNESFVSLVCTGPRCDAID